MSEPVLTDDEKSALLAGVSSGTVEVTSADGQAYASVKAFVVGPRSRIERDSLPRLGGVNEQLAERLARTTSSLVQAEVSVTATTIRRCGWGDYSDGLSPQSAVVVFTAAPFTGEALLTIDATLLGPLLDAFFGGHADGDVERSHAALSPGAMNMARLYARQVLKSLGEAFAAIREIAPEATRSAAGIDLSDVIDEDAAVVGSSFDVVIGEERGAFEIVWPAAMIAPVLPALEGKRAQRDAAEDARWAAALTTRLPEVSVALASDVGQATMTLGTLINLNPGDVIAIESPRLATVLAHGVPLLQGRFGVQAGRNAVETINWLEPAIGNEG